MTPLLCIVGAIIISCIVLLIVEIYLDVEDYLKLRKKNRD